jgi:uncharacterized membrane protein SpoIIM required for sporulation
MRETNFIRQNKQKWSEFEQILQQEKKDPDKLSNLFVQITDDLSYSRTFYPNRYVRVYLNNLAQRIFLNIYKNKREKRGRFLSFWKDDLPLLIYRCRIEFVLSLCIFLLSFGIGVFSSMHDPDFAQLILGEEYVQMTIENIESGDPMKVYKEMNGMDMFLGITLNNLRIAFMTFIFGILYAVGTIAILLYNGIMVGTFQYFFIERDLFRESFLTIWMHGTLEISAIIIAGAAGLVLGKGLVFPGTYSRLQSLQISARKSMKIMIGIAPIIVMAAIIESFFTRFTDAPDVVRLCVILFSLFFVITYFIWYPVQKARKTVLPPDVRLTAAKEQKIDTTQIRNNGEIFGDIFIFFRKRVKKVALTAASIALISTAVLWMINPNEWRDKYLFSTWSFLKIGNYFDYSSPVIFAVNTFAFAINAVIILWFITGETGSNHLKGSNLRLPFIKFYVRHLYKAFLVSLLLNSLLLFPFAVVPFLLIPIFPLALIWLFCMVYEDTNPFKALMRLNSFIGESFLRIFGLFLILSLVIFILYFFLDSPVIWLFVEVFQWNVVLEQETVNSIYSFIMRFFTLFTIHLLLPLAITGFSLQYFSLQEIMNASYLKQRIEIIGMKNGR